ncbi:MAG TPA: TolC family protein [Flavobacterium sp.]|nr:TolC family protein [Flavobacterium sp.]
MKKFILISAFIISNVVAAQEAMTFQNCLDLALQNNLDLKTAYNKQENAAYQYKASYGKILPAVYGEAENRNSWGREIDPDTNLYANKDLKYYKGTLSADFNLFSGFEVMNTIKYNKQEKKINDANVQRVTNAITIDLAQKFITILYLQEIVTANEDQIKSSEKQLELADLKFNSGVISESEVFKIKSQKATEELNLLTNQNHLSDNLISLKQLMNMPLEQEIILLKPNLELDKNTALLSDNQYELTKKAVEINPTYTMSLLKEQREKAALAIARSSRYPTLDMRLLYTSNFTDGRDQIYYDWQLKDNFSKGIRFNLVIPIFSQFEDFAKIKESKLNLKQAKYDTQIARNQLSKEVLKAITDTKTSVKKKESSSIAFEFSRKSYDADMLKFQLGKININELNNTKMVFNKSQAELIQSKYELLFNNSLIQFYLGSAFSL